MVSEDAARDRPTSAEGYEKAAEPSRGVGNVTLLEVPGSPAGKIRLQVPVLISRIAYVNYLVVVRQIVNTDSQFLH